MFQTTRAIALLLMTVCLPSVSMASNSMPSNHLQMTGSILGLICLGIFTLAYVFVISEEYTGLRKSKPVVLAAGLIWIIVGIIGVQQNVSPYVQQAIIDNISEYGQLLLFLLVAMTYINAMEERDVFQALKAWLMRHHFNYRELFWLTGILSFFISAVADNLTTALLMSAVVLAVGRDQPKFVNLACINLVVAANAGGTFSPFGDITTLMVWQMGVLPFMTFFYLFIPAVISFVIPALCMHFSVPKKSPPTLVASISMKVGAKRMIFLFIVTISLAVAVYQYLGLPPMLGMMTGLGLLKILSFYITRQESKNLEISRPDLSEIASFDIFRTLQRAEWDTLLFFYGVVLCVGGLATLGYLEIVSNHLYIKLGASLIEPLQALPANALIGILSAIVDNIPVMYAVLTMHPSMSVGQWLLVTLTVGIGGSLLSIGSAAGVALMGQARNIYTFSSHLKWSGAIALGYAAAIMSHVFINWHLFNQVV